MGLKGVSQLPKLSCLSNGRFGAPVTGWLWPVVLSDLRAALQPVRISGFGKCRLAGARAYSNKRPGADPRGLALKVAVHIKTVPGILELLC